MADACARGILRREVKRRDKRQSGCGSAIGDLASRLRKRIDQIVEGDEGTAQSFANWRTDAASDSSPDQWRGGVQQPAR